MTLMREIEIQMLTYIWIPEMRMFTYKDNVDESDGFGSHI